VAVNVTEQLAVAPLPMRRQLALEKAPARLLVNAAVPVGVIGVPLLVSLTVTVQVTALPGLGGDWHDSVAEVVRLLAVSTRLPALP
jgi:hypothetical protein